DTGFRPALRRLAAAGQLRTYKEPVDPHLDLAGLMKRLDGQGTLFFPSVKGFDMPVVGNLLCSQPTCETAFGLGYRQIREFIGRALSSPLSPTLVDKAPVQECVVTSGIDLGRMLPALQHTPAD